MGILGCGYFARNSGNIYIKHLVYASRVDSLLVYRWFKGGRWKLCLEIMILSWVCGLCGSVCLQCTLPTQPVARTMPLHQTVVPIPGNLFLLMEYFCIALDSQADQNLDQQRHSAGSSAEICVLWLAFSRANRRSAADLEKARVECAGWLCTLGCKSGCSTSE